jgi:hypothetical protein
MLHVLDIPLFPTSRTCWSNFRRGKPFHQYLLGVADNLQLDILFERRIPARQFKHTEVNAFDVALQHKIHNDSEDVLEASRA